MKGMVLTMCYQLFIFSLSTVLDRLVCYRLVLVAQSCLALCNPVDNSPLGSSVPRILQARKLEWGGWDLPGSEAPAITWPPWPTLFWAIQFSAGHLGSGLRPPLTSLSSLLPLGSSCPLASGPGSLPDVLTPAERKGAKPPSRGGTATTQDIVSRSGC